MTHSIRSLDRILKGEATTPEALNAGTIPIRARGLILLLVLLGALYGVCMGTFSLVTRWSGGGAPQGLLQMGYSAVKVPMLFFLTLVVTFPSLYVFNALVGCRLLLSSVLKLLIASLGVTLAVLASFGTIIAFFSLCTTSYAFMVLLNVAAFAVAGILGMNFLLKTLHRLAQRGPVGAESAEGSVAVPASEAAVYPAPMTTDGGPSQPTGRPPLAPLNVPRPRDFINPNVRAIFLIWVIVFGLVGSQMGWVLRPFIGKPDAPVTFFRAREGNFFQAVADKVQEAGWGQSQPHPTERR